MISHLSAIENWFTDFGVLSFPRFLRAVAYRWLVRWICGYMGWENTRPLPACVCHAIRQRFHTQMRRGYQSGQQRTEYWCLLLSPFCKLLSCLIYFLFQLKVKFSWAYVPLYICSYPCDITLSKRHNSCNNLFLLMN